MKLILSEQLGRGQRCTITNRTKDPEGFIATGAVVKDANGWDQEVILSAAVVREAARLLGLVEPSKAPVPDPRELEQIRSAISELKVAA